MGEITILGSQNNPWLETSEDNLRLFRTDLQTTETRIGTDCRQILAGEFTQRTERLLDYRTHT